MAYYDTCPICDANLDPGETCEDCADREREKREKLKQMEERLFENMDGQLTFQFAS